MRGDVLVVEVGLDPEIAEAGRKPQVDFLVAIVFGLLPESVADHRGVPEAVAGIGESLELGPDVGRAADAAEVRQLLLDRAVAPEFFGHFVDRSGQDAKEEVRARVGVSRL